MNRDIRTRPCFRQKLHTNCCCCCRVFATVPRYGRAYTKSAHFLLSTSSMHQYPAGTAVACQTQEGYAPVKQPRQQLATVLEEQHVDVVYKCTTESDCRQSMHKINRMTNRIYYIAIGAYFQLLENASGKLYSRARGYYDPAKQMPKNVRDHDSGQHQSIPAELSCMYANHTSRAITRWSAASLQQAPTTLPLYIVPANCLQLTLSSKALVNLLGTAGGILDAVSVADQMRAVQRMSSALCWGRCRCSSSCGGVGGSCSSHASSKYGSAEIEC